MGCGWNEPGLVGRAAHGGQLRICVGAVGAREIDDGTQGGGRHRRCLVNRLNRINRMVDYLRGLRSLHVSALTEGGLSPLHGRMAQFALPNCMIMFNAAWPHAYLHDEDDAAAAAL